MFEATPAIITSGAFASKPGQMMVAEDEDVVEHLAPEGAGESLRDGVHIGRPDRRLDDANGGPFDEDGRLADLDNPYPGGNLFSLASGGAIYMRDPRRRVGEDQLNGGEIVPVGDDDWKLIRLPRGERAALRHSARAPALHRRPRARAGRRLPQGPAVRARRVAARGGVGEPRGYTAKSRRLESLTSPAEAWSALLARPTCCHVTTSARSSRRSEALAA